MLRPALMSGCTVGWRLAGWLANGNRKGPQVQGRRNFFQGSADMHAEACRPRRQQRPVVRREMNADRGVSVAPQGTRKRSAAALSAARNRSPPGPLAWRKGAPCICHHLSLLCPVTVLDVILRCSRKPRRYTRGAAAQPRRAPRAMGAPREAAGARACKWGGANFLHLSS